MINLSDIYKHTKSGNHYLLLYIGKETDKARYVVIYQALYGNNEIWVRDFDEFFGSIKFQGEIKPRFQNVKIDRLPNIE